MNNLPNGYANNPVRDWDREAELESYEDKCDTLELGASPAELDGDVEQDRERSWADHDGNAELRLWEDSSHV